MEAFGDLERELDRFDEDHGDDYERCQACERIKNEANLRTLNGHRLCITGERCFFKALKGIDEAVPVTPNDAAHRLAKDIKGEV